MTCHRSKALRFFRNGVDALGWAVMSDTSPREIVGLSGGLPNLFGDIASSTTLMVFKFVIQNAGCSTGSDVGGS
jgi:ACS family glucarate transporter-like MFS transporter